MASPLEDNILEKDFRILTSLGSGKFGEVKLACHLPTQTQVAVKVLEKKKNAVAHINSEVKILQSVEHRNIVQFFHFIDTSTTTYVIMEYVAGKDLYMYLRETGFLKEEKARPIFQQVALGVHFLHQRLIAHRDIKLENILIDRAGKVKLCDFGMARQLAEGQMLKKVCGTLLYLAPEILARKPYDGLAVDMWSLGVLLYVLVTGQFPYAETTLDGMYRIITTTNYPIPYHLSIPCNNIIARLLMVQTRHRLTICQLLEREWLGSIKDHTAPATKEILPRVVETMCAMGYTCEDIVSSLKQRQPNNLTATFNIVKYQMSCGDSHQQNQKLWVNDSPVGPLRPLIPLKRRTSEPAFPTSIEDEWKHFHEEGVEGRGKRCQSYNNIAVNMNSVDSLLGDLSLCESALDGTPTWFLNKGFSTEEPFMRPTMPNDQPQDEPTTSVSKPLMGWKLIKKRISHALRALFSYSLPTSL